MNIIQKSSKRIDIFVKTLYIKGFLEGDNFNIYRKLYIKHIILMNGGIEDEKNNINQFEEKFQNLIKDIQLNGFNTNYPIPINKNGVIINGAHRLASCIYFGIKPIFHNIDSQNETIWDLEWFKKNNFSEKEILLIVEEYLKYNNDLSILILWPTLINQYKKIKKILRLNNIKTYGSFNLKLNQNTFKELVYDIYSYDGNIDGGIGIDEKIEILSKKSTNIEIIIIENKQDTKNIKEKIRNEILSNFSVIKSKYYTLHMGDSNEEECFLKSIIVNPNNIQNLKRRGSLISKNFLNKLKDLNNFIKKENINKNDICIVGSGPLGVFGLNKVSDIDIIKKIPLNKGIIKKGEIDILDYQYYKKNSNLEIIENNNYHFYFRGFKFINLDLLKIIKGNYGNREKDIEQAQIIESFLKNNIKNNFKNNLFIKFHFFIKRYKIKLLNIIIVYTKKIGLYKILSFLWRKYILKNIK